jgi:Flp pilus assembly protein TadB
MCIFVISVVLGLSVLTSFWIVLGYITVCNFLKSSFYSRYNARFFF